MGHLLHALHERQPLPTAAAALAHYSAMANEATMLQALREACKVIEDSARDAFFRTGMTQQEFEQSWRADELQRWGQWCRLKTVAGLPHTQPELALVEDDE